MAKERGIGGCVFFLVAVPTVILMIVLIISTIFFFVLRNEYLKWNSEFEGKRLASDFIIIEGDASKSIRESVKAKIDEFGKSEEKIDYIEFTKEEALILLGDEANTSLPKDFSVYRIDAETSKNLWIVYIQYKYKEHVLPWVVIHVEKDNIETAQLFLSRVYIGNINFEDYGVSIIRENINEGISSGLILVNQNNFTGRSFDNVALEKDKVVVKGSLY